MLAACGQEKASYLTVHVNFTATTSMPLISLNGVICGNVTM